MISFLMHSLSPFLLQFILTILLIILILILLIIIIINDFAFSGKPLIFLTR